MQRFDALRLLSSAENFSCIHHSHLITFSIVTVAFRLMDCLSNTNSWKWKCCVPKQSNASRSLLLFRIWTRCAKGIAHRFISRFDGKLLKCGSLSFSFIGIADDILFLKMRPHQIQFIQWTAHFKKLCKLIWQTSSKLNGIGWIPYAI